MEKVYLQLALDEKMELVSIYDVPTGIECNCTCSGCGVPLIAKNHNKFPDQTLLPGQKVAHFAHAGPECTWAAESAIHLLAKEVIKESKSFLIPDLHFKGKLLVKRKFLEFDEVRIEENIIDRDIRIKPDVTLIKSDRELYIEFYKTHAVDDHKIEKLKTLNKSCVEVNINDIEPLVNGKKNLEGIRKILKEDVMSKTWLHNTQQEVLYHKLLEKEKETEKELEELTPIKDKGQNEQKAQRSILDDDFLDDDSDWTGFTEEEWKKWNEKEERNRQWNENLLKEGYLFLKVYPGRGEWWGYKYIYCPKAKQEGRFLPVNNDQCFKCEYYRCEIFGWKEGEHIACGFKKKLRFKG